MKKILLALLILISCSKKEVSYTTSVIPKTDSTVTKKVTMEESLISSSQRSSIVCVGSNLTYGTDSATSYPAQLQTLLQNNGINNATVFNEGILWAQLDYMTSLIYQDITPNFISPGQNIAIAWEISEDVYDNRTAEATYFVRFKTYCQDLQSMGWKVIALTVPYRNIYYTSGGNYTPSGYDSTGYNQVINDLNDSLKLNWGSFSNGLADIGDSLTHYDPEYYQTDHFNLTPAGNLLVAKTVMEAMQNN